MPMSKVRAYTREQGGSLVPGEPPDDNWHTKFHANGWAFDRTLFECSNPSPKGPGWRWFGKARLKKCLSHARG